MIAQAIQSTIVGTGPGTDQGDPRAPSPFCRICKRGLSDEDSIKRGIGPVCWKKVGGFRRFDNRSKGYAVKASHLDNGGEIDITANYRVPASFVDYAIQDKRGRWVTRTTANMRTGRVSVRKQGELYQVYAHWHDTREEQVLMESYDLRALVRWESHEFGTGDYVKEEGS